MYLKQSNASVIELGHKNIYVLHIHVVKYLRPRSIGEVLFSYYSQRIKFIQYRLLQHAGLTHYRPTAANP